MFRLKLYGGLGFVSIAVLTTGCTTMRSTLYSPTAEEKCEPKRKHLRGVPTTLEVPTHLHVIVKRTRFAKVSDNGFVTFVPELETRDVQIEKKTQKEIFGVDFQRPAAGTLAYNTVFQGQSITKVNNALEDKTIEKVTDLVTTILKTVPPPMSRFNKTTTGSNSLISFEDVIASDVFPINEPGVDCRIQEFLNIYVNNCHDCHQDRQGIPISPTQPGSKPLDGFDKSSPAEIQRLPVTPQRLPVNSNSIPPGLGVGRLHP